MNGTGNVLLNEGTITGEAYAILDGDGDSTVINGAYLFGDIDLGGGNDAMVIREGARFDGVVRGGAGNDELIAAMRSPDPGAPVGEDTIIGNRFTEFEDFTKVGVNRLILNGTLDVSTALVQRGELRLGSGASITGTTTVGTHGFLTGTGEFGNVFILDDGIGAVGSSAGHWDIAGDLHVLGGILELEIGPTLAESDLITVGGTALFDLATIRLLFIDDFIPAVDEVFEVLLADQILGFDTISFDVFGLTSELSLVPSFDNMGGMAFRTIASAVAEPVPEPSTFLLLGGGLAGLAFYARRRRKE